jgi:hypothetical protein
MSSFAFLLLLGKILDTTTGASIVSSTTDPSLALVIGNPTPVDADNNNNNNNNEKKKKL